MSYMKVLYEDLSSVEHLPDYVLAQIVLYHAKGYEVDTEELNDEYAQKMVKDFRIFRSYHRFVVIRLVYMRATVDVFDAMEEACNHLAGYDGYIIALAGESYNIFKVNTFGELIKPVPAALCKIRNAMWNSEEIPNALGYAIEDCFTRNNVDDEVTMEVLEKE